MRLHVYLPKELAEWIRERAKEERRGVSNYLSILVEEKREAWEQEYESAADRPWLEAADLADKVLP